MNVQTPESQIDLRLWGLEFYTVSFALFTTHCRLFLPTSEGLVCVTLIYKSTSEGWILCCCGYFTGPAFFIDMSPSKANKTFNHHFVNCCHYTSSIFPSSRREKKCFKIHQACTRLQSKYCTCSFIPLYSVHIEFSTFFQICLRSNHVISIGPGDQFNFLIKYRTTTVFRIASITAKPKEMKKHTTGALRKKNKRRSALLSIESDVALDAEYVLGRSSRSSRMRDENPELLSLPVSSS